MSMIETTDLIWQSAKTKAKGTRLSFPATRIEAGQHTLLLGPSGSGKTTWLSLLGGLQKPALGRISVAGQPLHELKPAARDAFRGQHIGIVFQQLHLVQALTVRQNVILACRMAGIEKDSSHIDSLLKQLGLSALQHRHPHTLSQGQAQRVAIARALANKPKLILADEPTAALDDENAKAVCQLLSKQAQLHGATLVIATHDSRLVEAFGKNVIRLGGK